MSKELKLNWLAVIILAVLITCIGWLVWLDLKPSNGLTCVYNCDEFKTVLQGLR